MLHYICNLGRESADQIALTRPRREILTVTVALLETPTRQ
jgi:hypothetical protein